MLQAILSILQVLSCCKWGHIITDEKLNPQEGHISSVTNPPQAGHRLPSFCTITNTPSLF